MARNTRRSTLRATLAAGASACVLTLAAAGLAPTRIELPAAVGEAVGIGAIRLEGGLVGAAFAQSSDVTVEDVVVTVGSTTYRIPSVTFVGVNLSRDRLAQALRGEGGRPWGELLSEIDAREVAAPEVILEQTVEGRTQRIVYRDVAGEEIRAGRIARVTIAETTFEAPDQASQARFGETLFEGLDLAFSLRWSNEAAPKGGPNPMTTVYERFVVKDMTVKDEEGAGMRIGAMEGTAFRARLLATPFAEMAPLFEAASQTDEPTDEQARAMIGFAVDLLRSVDFGQITMLDVAFDAPEAGGEVMRIAEMGFGKSDDLPEGGFWMAGVEVEAEGARFAIEEVGFYDISIEPALAALGRIAENPGLAIDEQIARAFAPTTGVFSLVGLEARIPEPDGPDSDPLEFTLASVDVAVTDLVDGVPTRVEMSFDNAAFSIPKTKDEFLTQLVAMGYEALDMSGGFAMSWTADARELVVEEVFLSGVDMGVVSFAATLGEIGKEAFSGDPEEAMMAFIGATFRDAKLSLANHGVADRILELQAREMGVSVEEMRAQLVQTARGMIPMMLGNTPDGRAVGAAVASFLEEPNELDILVEAKDAAGVPLIELQMADDPMAFLPLLRLSAEVR